MAVVLATTLLLLGFGAWILLNRGPKPALQIASTFCVVNGWSNGDEYYWLDNDRALVVLRSSDPPGRLEVFDSRPARPSCVSRPLPFTAPTSILRIASPNGRFLAYLDQSPAQNRMTYLVVKRMDGRNVVRVELSLDGDVFWSPDSKSVIQLRMDNVCIRRLSLDTGRVERSALPSGLRPGESLGTKIVGFTGTETVLIARNGVTICQDPKSIWGIVNYPRLPMIEVSLVKPSRVVRTYSPAVPAGAGLGFVVLSPSGDRLFWGALCEAKASPLLTRIHRWFKFVPADDFIVERGWVSRLDGSRMKEIGFHTLPAAALKLNGSAREMIGDPKWTPDGKRISFVYKGRIMTVPVD